MNVLAGDRGGGRPLLLGLALLVQTALCLPGLSQQPLWLDEAYSAVLARHPVPEIVSYLRHDSGPPLSYALLHAWRLAFGESDAALRSLSLGFALLTTVLLFGLAHRLLGRAAAGIAVLLWVTAPLAHRYAIEARHYALFAALAVAYFFCLREHGETRSRPALVGLAVLSTALVYTHNVAWFLLLAGILTTLIAARERRAVLGPVIAAGIAAVLFLPWAPIFREQLRNIAWVRSLWTPWALGRTFVAYLPGGLAPGYVGLLPLAGRIQWVLGGLVAVALAGAIAARRRIDRNLLWIVLFLATGLLGPYLVSFLGSPVYLPGRTDFALFPFWCLALAAALAALPWPAVRWSVLTLLTAAGLVTIGLQYARPAAMNERNLTRFLEPQVRPGDVVLCAGLTRPVLEHGLRDRGLVFVSYPRDMAWKLAHLEEDQYLRGVDLRRDAESVLRDVEPRLRSGARLWVVAGKRPLNRPLLEALLRDKALRPGPLVESPGMGLQRLNEPLFVARMDPAGQPNR